MSRAASPVLDGWSFGQVCVHFGIMTLCFVYLFFFFFLCGLIWSSGRKWNVQEWYKEFDADCRLAESSVSTHKSWPWPCNGGGCQWRQQISSQLRETVEEMQSLRDCGQAFQVQNLRKLWSQTVFGGLDVDTVSRATGWWRLGVDGRSACCCTFFVDSRIFIPLTLCGVWGVENYTAELTVQ